MAFGTITSTENTFGSVDGTTTGVVPGTLTGSVGVPGPAGPGVPAGGTTGQFLAKTSDTDYATGWTTLSLSGYATESWVTSGFYPLTGNPSGFLDSATANTLYYSIDNPSGFITSYDASVAFYPLSGNPSSFLVAADIAGKADLASPALTGTPTAPTASPGTDSTQLATTAFVQQEVPAASTTAAGKVELATRAEAIEPSSSTLAVSPLRSLEMQMHPGFVQVAQNNNNVVTTTSGTGAGIFTTSLTRVCLGPNTSVAGYSYYRPQTNGGVAQFVARGTANAVINFSKKFWMSGRSCYDATNYGDTNNTSRVTVGRSTTGAGALAQKGIGWQKAGGTGSNIFLLAHNGTTLTSVDTNTSLTSLGIGAGACFDWFIYSDGSGNVTMWINDTQVATTSSGPTGNSTASSVWQEEIDQSSSAARRMYFSNFSGHYYHV